MLFFLTIISTPFIFLTFFCTTQTNLFIKHLSFYTTQPLIVLLASHNTPYHTSWFAYLSVWAKGGRARWISFCHRYVPDIRTFTPSLPSPSLHFQGTHHGQNDDQQHHHTIPITSLLPSPTLTFTHPSLS